MKIIVYFKFKNTEIEVSLETTMKEIKEKIITNKKVEEVGECKLIFNGKVLEDKNTVGFYNLQENNRIVMVVSVKKHETQKSNGFSVKYFPFYYDSDWFNAFKRAEKRALDKIEEEILRKTNPEIFKPTLSFKKPITVYDTIFTHTPNQKPMANNKNFFKNGDEEMNYVLENYPEIAEMILGISISGMSKEKVKLLLKEDYNRNSKGIKAPSEENQQSFKSFKTTTFPKISPEQEVAFLLVLNLHPKMVEECFEKGNWDDVSKALFKVMLIKLYGNLLYNSEIKNKEWVLGKNYKNQGANNNIYSSEKLSPLNQTIKSNESQMTGEEIEKFFYKQLSQLQEMGFKNKKMNIEALRKANGDIDKAITLILEKKNKD